MNEMETANYKVHLLSVGIYAVMISSVLISDWKYQELRYWLVLLLVYLLVETIHVSLKYHFDIYSEKFKNSLIFFHFVWFVWGNYIIISATPNSGGVYVISLIILIIQYLGFCIKCLGVSCYCLFYDPPPEPLQNLEHLTEALADSKAEDCSICLEGFGENKESRNLPCDHVFHRACIDKWLLEYNHNCPVCRRDLMEENI